MLQHLGRYPRLLSSQFSVCLPTILSVNCRVYFSNVQLQSFYWLFLSLSKLCCVGQSICSCYNWIFLTNYTCSLAHCILPWNTATMLNLREFALHYEFSCLNAICDHLILRANLDEVAALGSLFEMAIGMLPWTVVLPTGKSLLFSCTHLISMRLRMTNQAM